MANGLDLVAAGMDGYVTKPVDPNRLATAIAEVIGVRAAGSTRHGRT